MNPLTSGAATGADAGTSLTGGSDRIQVLDVLRGIALLGMFLVHFSDYSSGGGKVDAAYQNVVSLFFEERFWTMFGILFGAGFAIQFLRSDARGESFVPKYLRRLAGLAAFGCFAHAVFGFNVLLGYAIWGLPLLLVRKWSIRVLLVALVISAASGGIYQVARTAYGVATQGEAVYRAQRTVAMASDRAFNQANREAQDATNYSTVFPARLRHMRWFYAQWFSFLPVNTFTLFLLGVLALRLGLFDHPGEHRRLIATLMILGAASWATSTWLLPASSAQPRSPIVLGVAVNWLKGGLGVIRTMWLSFTYIGAILLLVARNRAWLGRFAAFAWTGRMALTNYMIQIAILDLTFSNYALGVTITPLAGLMAAVGLFLADALFSRWWLVRFRYGPLEWLWRSITYARWQPWRVGASPNAPSLVAG